MSNYDIKVRNRLPTPLKHASAPTLRTPYLMTSSFIEFIHGVLGFWGFGVLGHFSQFYAIPVHTTEIIQINNCLLVIGYPPHEVSLVHHTPSSLYSPKSALKSKKMPKRPFFDPLEVKF